MSLFALILLGSCATSHAQDPEQVEVDEEVELVVESEVQTVQAPAEEIAEQQVKVGDLKNDLLGFEFFLIDQEQFGVIKKKCECELTWEQPSIDKYKAAPKSYLPVELLKKAGEGYVYPAPSLPEQTQTEE